MLRARLKVIGGKQRGKSIPLTASKFLIGREGDCQLRPSSELVSRHHCAITVDEFTVRLRDLGSTNGTFVNDELVNGQVTLKSGDRVRVGKLQFEMVITKLTEEEAAGLSDPGSATALADILKNQADADTTELSGSETAHEIQLPIEITTGDSSTDQSDLEDSGTFELNAAPGQSDSAVHSQAHVANPDTSVVPQQSIVPSDPAQTGYPPQPGMAYPQPPQYSQPAPYPQMPMPYPQPPMPYPQAQMPYAQPGMYAPPMYPMQQQPAMYPQQPAPPLPELPEEESDDPLSSIPEVSLPDPKQTGAKPEEPKPEKTESDQSESEQMNPSDKAADIIRQHMQRRPGT